MRRPAHDMRPKALRHRGGGNEEVLHLKLSDALTRVRVEAVGIRGALRRGQVSPTERRRRATCSGPSGHGFALRVFDAAGRTGTDSCQSAASGGGQSGVNPGLLPAGFPYACRSDARLTCDHASIQRTPIPGGYATSRRRGDEQRVRLVSNAEASCY